MGIKGNEAADKEADERASKGHPIPSSKISLSYLKEARKVKRIRHWKKLFHSNDLGPCQHYKEHCKFRVKSLTLPDTYTKKNDALLKHWFRLDVERDILAQASSMKIKIGTS